MRLINAQGEIVQPGARLVAIQGKEIGRHWKYSHVLEHPVDGHRVHVVRRHPKLGHVHREFHPGVFGLVVEVDIKWSRHLVNTAHHARQKFDEYLLAGVVALVPLAFFEQFHLAEKVGELIGH